MGFRGDIEPEQLQQFFSYHSNAVTAVPTKKYLAMVTGILKVKINGEFVNCMIDTGSELNVASMSVYETNNNLALDYAGMDWSLKGIHGGPEQLAGLLTDVPLMLGEHEFSHHMFLSKQQLSPKYEIILGQPFLQWYACQIQYGREGGVKLFLWKDGDKDQRPTVGIAITNPTDPRNTTKVHHRVSPEETNRSSQTVSGQYFH